MKKVLILSLVLFNAIPLIGQTVSFNAECDTDFWTITADGHIQQWSLSNGSISGGDTILSGGGTCLAFCGTANTPTFYSNDWTQVGIKYYDLDSGWKTISTPVVVDHGGGYLNDLYYRSEGAVIQIIKYWDGMNLTTVDSFNGEFFAGTQDIAVDTLGRAWVFTGFAPSSVDSLKVYDRNGRITAYTYNNDLIAYGSFFLNDTLYIGSVQDSIHPVIINGTNAQLGDGIFFPASSFTDMAGCQETKSTNSISELPLNSFKIYPNPTEGRITLPVEFEGAIISVFNIQGKLVQSTIARKILDIGNLAEGKYLITAEVDGRTHSFKVVKL